MAGPDQARPGASPKQPEQSAQPVQRPEDPDLMLRSALMVGSILFFAATLAACAGDDDEGASSSMKLTTKCEQTRCDARHARDSLACSRCTSAALNAMYYSSSIDVGSSCTYSCSTSTCDESDRTTCEDTSFSFEVQAPPDPKLQEGCERMFDHAKACGTTTTVDKARCATWAKVERPEMVAVYECAANAACDSSASCGEPAKGAFGSEICDGLRGRCADEPCSAELRATVDDLGSWLKTDVKDAARSCLEQRSCNDARGCFNAWASAIGH